MPVPSRPLYPARLTRAAKPRDRAAWRHGDVRLGRRSRHGRVLRHRVSINRYTVTEAIARALYSGPPARIAYSIALQDLRRDAAAMRLVHRQIENGDYWGAVHELRRLSAQLERAIASLATI